MISRIFPLLAGLIILLLPLFSLAQGIPSSESPRGSAQQLARQVFAPDPRLRKVALLALEKRGDPDVVPALIQALRFVPDNSTINAILTSLTGDRPGLLWHDWMLWQESHPEIKPFAGFDAFKADVMSLIDENFRLFLKSGVKHDIRLEEIVWGGVRKDGIPALINPTLIAPSAAAYTDNELVFGIEINGDARAYPLRILNWHEMFNDVIGGVPVALAYCTLCGSGILYETLLPSAAEPLIFGSSGFLYRSNKLMYDQGSNSLWNQFTGRPVVGPLTGSGIELKVRPVTITTWKNWRQLNPKTKVLSLDTGYNRDYRPGRAYGEYFEGPDLMFPALVPDTLLKPKDFVFALRAGAVEKAWPLSAFKEGAVINDTVGPLDVVLIGNTATRTVRAYMADGLDFKAIADQPNTITAGDTIWKVEEDALVNKGGQRLKRLAGHIAYWFAWRGFRPEATLYNE